MDVHSREQRSRNTKAIKSSDTKMELVLRRALWNEGYRYRKNNKKVYGKPDLTFGKQKVAVFVDSEFFHGKDWVTTKFRIKSNREFWWKKIERNIERDKEVNRILVDKGWKVLRFWSKEIEKDLDICLVTIEAALKDAEV